MKKLENIDLNAICRILEWMAIITLVLGIIGSFFLGIHKIEKYHHDEIEINWGIILVGIIISLTDFVFLLFLSRVGDAVDDIRNKYVYSNIDENEEEKEQE